MELPPATSVFSRGSILDTLHIHSEGQHGLTVEHDEGDGGVVGVGGVAVAGPALVLPGVGLPHLGQLHLGTPGVSSH